MLGLRISVMLALSVVSISDTLQPTNAVQSKKHITNPQSFFFFHEHHPFKKFNIKIQINIKANTMIAVIFTPNKNSKIILRPAIKTEIINANINISSVLLRVLRTFFIVILVIVIHLKPFQFIFGHGFSQIFNAAVFFIQHNSSAPLFSRINAAWYSFACYFKELLVLFA
jgi:hypothetical protein